MTTSEIKDRIKKRFKTIAAFCRTTGMRESKVRMALSRDIPSARAFRKEIVKAIRKTEPMDYIPGFHLNPLQSEAIRMAIAKRYRFAVDLHNEHPEFSPAFLSNVINGKAVTQCKRVKALAEILEIELSDYEPEQDKTA